jgi:hypothetical protein
VGEDESGPGGGNFCWDCCIVEFWSEGASSVHWIGFGRLSRHMSACRTISWTRSGCGTPKGSAFAAEL